MNHLLKYLALTAAAATLSACFGNATPPPEEHYYRLPPVAPASRGSTRLTDKLSVQAMQTGGLHHERAILYVESASALELQRYHYHFWVLPPSQLVQEHLISFLRERGLAHTVLRSKAQSNREPSIGGYLKRFERVIDNGAIHVDVELELQYLENGKPVLIREYRRRPPVADASMPATVKAFGTALQAIFADFAAELAK